MHMSDANLTTRDRIVAAAFKLFSEQGIDNTTTREIASAAEVNEVTLFRHFGNKDGIVQAAIEFSIPNVSLPKLNNLQFGDDIEANLRELTQAIVEIHNQREEFVRFCFLNIMAEEMDQNFIQNIQHPMLTWLSDVFEPYCKECSLSAMDFAVQFAGPIILHGIQKFFLGGGTLLYDDQQFAKVHAKIYAAALLHLGDS